MNRFGVVVIVAVVLLLEAFAPLSAKAEQQPDGSYPVMLCGKMGDGWLNFGDAQLPAREYKCWDARRGLHIAPMYPNEPPALCAGDDYGYVRCASPSSVREISLAFGRDYCYAFDLEYAWDIEKTFSYIRCVYAPDYGRYLGY